MFYVVSGVLIWRGLKLDIAESNSQDQLLMQVHALRLTSRRYLLFKMLSTKVASYISAKQSAINFKLATPLDEVPL